MTRAKKIASCFAALLLLGAFLVDGVEGFSKGLIRVGIGLGLLWPFLTNLGHGKFGDYIASRASTPEGRAGLYSAIVGAVILAVGFWIVALFLGSPKGGIHDARPLLVIISMLPLGMAYWLYRILQTVK